MHARLMRFMSLAPLAVAVMASWPGASVAAQNQGPARATTAAANSPDVKVLQIAPNMYMLTGGGGNVALQVEPSTRPPRIPGTYIGAYGVLLVDSGTAAASEQIQSAIRSLSPGPLRYIINTHIHPDHMGGNEAFAKQLAGRGRGIPPTTILSHENMLVQLASPEGNAPRPPQGAMPTDAYLDVKEIWFNGESIQVIHQPGAHTDADSIVYFRKSDVISAGDIFSTTSYPIIGGPRGGGIQGIIDGLNHILDLAVPESNAEGGTKIIPGHGRLSDEADVVEYRNMVVIIRDRIRDLVGKGMTVEQVKAAKVSLDYDFRYGATSGRWTTDMFIDAVYKELKAAVPARTTSAAPAGRANRTGTP